MLLQNTPQFYNVEVNSYLVYEFNTLDYPQHRTGQKTYHGCIDVVNGARLLITEDDKQYNAIHFIETRLQDRIGTVIKKTDGLVNRLASNLVISNQAHRVAWLIGQEKILKQLGELDKEEYIPIHIYN